MQSARVLGLGPFADPTHLVHVACAFVGIAVTCRRPMIDRVPSVFKTTRTLSIRKQQPCVGSIVNSDRKPVTGRQQRHRQKGRGRAGFLGASRAAKTSAAAAHAGETRLHISEAVADLKKQLKAAFQPVQHRGLFGLQAAELERIKAAAEALEAHNPLSNPTEHLDFLAGRWTVCFSTIRVTGSRRVKLGLRDLVQIGDLTQEIDPSQNTAVNRVAFNVPAFGIRNGELILKASYQTSSSNRVTIQLQQATLVPQRLQSVFEANFDLLLSIFNPAGFLDITYCDGDLRCGRDDKGNLFVLERP